MIDKIPTQAEGEAKPVCCGTCGSQLPEPAGLDWLAFQLRKSYWAPDYMSVLVRLAWQLLDKEEQEGWRRVARSAQALSNMLENAKQQKEPSQ